MSKARRQNAAQPKTVTNPPSNLPHFAQTTVNSLLDHMQDGYEYQSIVSLTTPPHLDLINEVVRGIAEIEQVRGRKCLAYVGNVVKQDNGMSSVDSSDDLPFTEMVGKVPASERKIDILLATRGGSGEQISRFVNCLRSRFDEVDFLIPSMCMSAGTLFALSGDRIWMGQRACLGPIDPQVPTKDGRFVPAQALLLLVKQLQMDGDRAMSNGQSVPWTAVRIIDSMDKKELGDAMTATGYSTRLATEFLLAYKFKNWSTREGSQQPTTPEYKIERAQKIANALASHDRWRNHGHSISREVLWNEIQLKIDHPSQPLDRALRRSWALFNWLFDKGICLKIIASSDYRYVVNPAISIGVQR